MIMLTLGTGVGGGLILDGRPYRGAVGAAAELGHIVIEHDGRPCQGTCTGRGHLEAYATGVAAASDAQAAFGPDADARDLLERANEGDERALEILQRDRPTARLRARLAREHLQPGGDRDRRRVGRGGRTSYLLEPAREVMKREALSPGRELVRVVPAELGPDAGLVGAGFVAFEALTPTSPGDVGRCRSPSARRRSETSTTSRCACSTSCARPTSCCARTRA